MGFMFLFVVETTYRSSSLPVAFYKGGEVFGFFGWCSWNSESTTKCAGTV